jgi:hypothetical protein
VGCGCEPLRYAIQQWLQTTEIAEDVIVISDPDCVYLWCCPAPYDVQRTQIDPDRISVDAAHTHGQGRLRFSCVSSCARAAELMCLGAVGSVAAWMGG